MTLDGNDTVSATYTYTAFGNTTVSGSDNTGNPYKYVGALGYYADPSSGLVLLGARYYNRNVGRFTTLDPIRDSLNWYLYVKNQPLGSVDPEGMEKWICTNEKPPPSKWFFIRAIYRFHWCRGCLHSCQEWCHEESNEHCWSDNKHDDCIEACSEGQDKCQRNKKEYKFEISF